MSKTPITTDEVKPLVNKVFVENKFALQQNFITEALTNALNTRSVTTPSLIESSVEALHGKYKEGNVGANITDLATSAVTETLQQAAAKSQDPVSSVSKVTANLPKHEQLDYATRIQLAKEKMDVMKEEAKENHPPVEPEKKSGVFQKLTKSLLGEIGKHARNAGLKESTLHENGAKSEEKWEDKIQSKTGSKTHNL